LKEKPVLLADNFLKKISTVKINFMMHEMFIKQLKNGMKLFTFNLIGMHPSQDVRLVIKVK